tara:strand:+ start:5824 stop:6141 length:318 start_codon:yes stop_codon:yes gene_type:complete
MDCQSDENKCDEIFGECRCYADVNSEDPKNAQVCGIRKNGYVVPCKPGCCHGGCPGQCKGAKAREPYSFGNYTIPVPFEKTFKLLFISMIILVILSTILVFRKMT